MIKDYIEDESRLVLSKMPLNQVISVRELTLTTGLSSRKIGAILRRCICAGMVIQSGERRERRAKGDGWQTVLLYIRENTLHGFNKLPTGLDKSDLEWMKYWSKPRSERLKSKYAYQNL